jgi:hypothetical protein
MDEEDKRQVERLEHLAGKIIEGSPNRHVFTQALDEAKQVECLRGMAAEWDQELDRGIVEAEQKLRIAMAEYICKGLPPDMRTDVVPALEQGYVFCQESDSRWHIGWHGTEPLYPCHMSGFARIRDIINAGVEGVAASKLAPVTERLEDGTAKGKVSRIDTGALEDAKENLANLKRKKEDKDEILSATGGGPDADYSTIAEAIERTEGEIKRLSSGHTERRERPDETVRISKERALKTLTKAGASTELVEHLEKYIETGKLCRYTGGLNWNTM